VIRSRSLVTPGNEGVVGVNGFLRIVTCTPKCASIANVISMQGLEINVPTTPTFTVRFSSGNAHDKPVRN
jgi:hypothetical protein